MTTAVAHTMALATTAANGLGAVNTGGSVLLPEGNYLLDVSAFVASTGAMTTGILAIEVSGAPVGINPQFSFAAGAAAEDIPMSDTWYFQSTGANPVSVVMTVVGAGTITGNAQLRIVAV